MAAGNLASQRVLAKAGMRLLEVRVDDDGSSTHVHEVRVQSAGQRSAQGSDASTAAPYAGPGRPAV